MDKVNQPYTFHLLMPEKLDFGKQVQIAHRIMGFDELDANTEKGMLRLVKFMPYEEITQFLWGILKQNTETREWLKHLFASDYERVVASKKSNPPWQHLAHFPKSAARIFVNYYPGEFDTEEREDLTVLRIKEDTFERLYSKTREKLQLALGLAANPNATNRR